MSILCYLGNVSCLTNNMTTPINIRRFSLSSNITNSGNTSTILESSSIQRMSPGKRKLLSKSRLTSPIPMIDLTTEETTDEAIYKGVSTGIIKITLLIELTK